LVNANIIRVDPRAADRLRADQISAPFVLDGAGPRADQISAPFVLDGAMTGSPRQPADGRGGVVADQVRHATRGGRK
jgi:hypothetical protein